ncbi:MAG: hypothetical protein J6Y53_03955 [Alphaproteobacteria bacterium]|nr:hypothetical protein [Alphaproteobacteria bacterium]
MPLFSLTDVYKLEKSCKVGETQKLFLKAKYGDHKVVINGIPADVDLSGNVEMQTWHAEQKLSDAEKKKDEARPDKIEIYKVDDKGYIVPKSGVDLFRKEDGTYRYRTAKEVQKSDEMNAAIISSLLSIKENS